MGALTTIGSILGMVLGTAGFTVSVLNYLRDRPKVKVLLQWNMTDSRTGIVKGLVRVTNIGRRPVFIGAAAIQIEGGATYLLSDAIPGTKLQEGDKPAGYMVNHEGMEKHSGSGARSVLSLKIPPARNTGPSIPPRAISLRLG